MDNRRIAVSFAALMLAVLLVTPSTASPGSEAGIMQTGSEDGQPDAENNTIYLFGNMQLSNCYSKFNSTDESSADYGEESKSSGTLDVKVTCRMDPTLGENIALAEGEMIMSRFTLELDGEWTNGQGGCNVDCENLNISLLKGNRVVAIKEFDSLSTGQNQINWDFPVEGDLIYWNGSTDTMAIEFTMKLKAIEGILWSGTDALFGLYYAHPENANETYPMMTFPILNQTAFEDLNPPVSGGGSGDDGGILPGFTSMIGIGGLAAAALLRPKPDDE